MDGGQYDLRLPPPHQRNTHNDNNPFIPGAITVNSFKESEHIYKVNHDHRLNINYLDTYTLFEEERILLLSGQIDTMNNSIDIATKFFMFTGIITVIIGSIAAFMFSRKFTKPITELKAISVSMSHLDFSHKYNVRSDDEIGELGSSINSLSDQLNHSISELREVNKKLKKDIEKERELDQMRKEFVSNVSHELKTPISLIQGYAEGLKKNVVDDEESKNYYCEVIIDEALKMEKHVKELLELSQLESGVFRIESTQFDLSSLISDIITRFERIFDEKQINLTTSMPSGLFVIADKIRIEQIILNYINNAMNHINQKKRIDIGISETTENKIRLSVYNTGSPLPGGEMTKIWDSYYKVDKARTRTYGGTGLGLSIVKAIQENTATVMELRTPTAEFFLD